MENEPEIKINPPEEEKKKKPKLLWKRMEELERLGWTVKKLEESDGWRQCQTCGEQANWVIETNDYCNRCMSQKADEFKEEMERRRKPSA